CQLGLLRLRLRYLLLGQGVSLRGLRLLAGAIGIGFCLFRGPAIPIRLLALTCLLLGLGLGFGFLLLCLLRLTLCLLRPLAHGGAFCVLLFLLTAFKGQYPRILRRLCCSTGYGGDGFATLLATQIILSPGQEVFRFAHRVRCVAISSFRLGYGYGVARLQQIVWSLGVGCAGGKLCRSNVNRILPALKYVKLSVDRLLPTFCVLLYDIF